jgi:hypothetical protein
VVQRLIILVCLALQVIAPRANQVSASDPKTPQPCCCCGTGQTCNCGCSPVPNSDPTDDRTLLCSCDNKTPFVPTAPRSIVRAPERGEWVATVAVDRPAASDRPVLPAIRNSHDPPNELLLIQSTIILI